jgi:hypothetical protein
MGKSCLNLHKRIFELIRQHKKQLERKNERIKSQKRNKKINNSNK